MLPLVSSNHDNFLFLWVGHFQITEISLIMQCVCGADMCIFEWVCNIEIGSGYLSQWLATLVLKKGSFLNLEFTD